MVAQTEQRVTLGTSLVRIAINRARTISEYYKIPSKCDAHLLEQINETGH